MNPSQQTREEIKNIRNEYNTGDAKVIPLRSNSCFEALYAAIPLFDSFPRCYIVFLVPIKYKSLINSPY